MTYEIRAGFLIRNIRAFLSFFPSLFYCLNAQHDLGSDSRLKKFTHIVREKVYGGHLQPISIMPYMYLQYNICHGISVYTILSEGQLRLVVSSYKSGILWTHSNSDPRRTVIRKFIINISFK